MFAKLGGKRRRASWAREYLQPVERHQVRDKGIGQTDGQQASRLVAGKGFEGLDDDRRTWLLRQRWVHCVVRAKATPSTKITPNPIHTVLRAATWPNRRPPSDGHWWRRRSECS